MAPRVIIRKMTETDTASVLIIERQTQIAPWEQALFTDSLQVYSCWVAEVQQEIIGFGIISIKKSVNESHIMNIAVNKNWQHQGIGRALLKHLLDCALAGNGKHVFLEVRKSNQRALNLYRAFGFNEIAERKDYYSTPNGREDAIILALEL